ncbi:MAG: flagellin [Pseudomonadota bacterium]
MTSILTNNSAMVALQTLNSINKDLTGIQSQISTGKKVGSAKDNAAVWAISAVMESDVKGFKAISESLSLGASTVALGRQAAERTEDLLKEIKGKIVSAQEENVPRDKLQADIDGLVEQITSVVGTAQFNGKNLVNNFDETNVLSSLDRASDGSVTAGQISFRGQSLTDDSGTLETANAIDRIGSVADDGTYTVGAGATLDSAGVEATLTVANDLLVGETLTIDFADEQFVFTNNTGGDLDADALDDIVAAGIAALGVEGVTTAAAGAGVVEITSTNKFDSITIQGSSSGTTTVDIDPDAGGALGAAGPGVAATMVARAETLSLGGGAGNIGGAVSEGDGFRVSLDGQDFDYVAKEGDTLNDVALGLKRVIDAGGLEGISVKVNTSNDPVGTPPTIQIDNDNAATVALTVDDGSGGQASGGLVGLSGIDVSTQEGAERALANIESLIQTAIDSAAEFGSVEGRIDIQAEFVSNLTDAFTSGIGALVDANLEEASARLQALQVQQQLGIQALSIANQAPQSVLSLFR